MRAPLQDRREQSARPASDVDDMPYVLPLVGGGNVRGWKLKLLPHEPVECTAPVRVVLQILPERQAEEAVIHRASPSNRLEDPSRRHVRAAHPPFLVQPTPELRGMVFDQRGPYVCQFIVTDRPLDKETLGLQVAKEPMESVRIRMGGLRQIGYALAAGHDVVG